MATNATNPKSKLTDQQILFCRLYAQSLNAERAYIDAGYKVKSAAIARSGASRLLTNVHVRSYLSEVCGLNEVSVLSAVSAIAFTPITEVVKWDGETLTVRQTDFWTDRAKLAVKKIKVTTKTRYIPETESSETTVETEVEMYDRLSALDKLMRKLKMYPKAPTALEWLDEGVKLGLIPAAIEEMAVDGIGKVMAEAKSAIAGELSETKSKQAGLSPATIEQIKRSVLGIQGDP